MSSNDPVWWCPECKLLWTTCPCDPGTPIDLVAVYEKYKADRDEAQRIVAMPKDGYAFAAACAELVSRLYAQKMEAERAEP